MWWNRERAELKVRLARFAQELVDLTAERNGALSSLAANRRAHEVQIACLQTELDKTLAIVADLQTQIDALRIANSSYSAALAEAVAIRDLYQHKLDHIRDHASTADAVVITEVA